MQPEVRVNYAGRDEEVGSELVGLILFACSAAWLVTAVE